MTMKRIQLNITILLMLFYLFCTSNNILICDTYYDILGVERNLLQIDIRKK